MRTLPLLALLAAACGSSSIGVTDPDELDTDAPDTDTDADTDADTDPDTDPPPPPPATWYGEREFTFGAICRDELIEEGVEITNDREWAEWVEACEGCERVFLVSVEQEDLCGNIPVTQEFVTGLIFDGDRRFEMVRVFEQRDRIRTNSLATGQRRNGQFFYDYEGTYNRTGYEVLGFGEIREP